MKLRFLNAKKDLRLFEEAWKWQFDKPDWWRELFSIWQESREEFLAKRFNKASVDIGVFEKRKLVALITLEEVSPGIFEAHVDAQRRTCPTLIIKAGLACRQYLFEKEIKEIFIYIAAQNRPLGAICAAIGFERTNVELLFGTFRGEVVKWEQLVLKNNCN